MRLIRDKKDPWWLEIVGGVLMGIILAATLFYVVTD